MFMWPVINQSRYLLLDRQEVLARMKEKSTILIVDDSELNRTILADILGDEYNFIEAGKRRTRDRAAADAHRYRPYPAGYGHAGDERL